MSYRDDFNSSMSSPGTYGSNTTYGSPGYSGGYGGTNNPGSGFTTPAQANFAAQGGSFAPGFGFGAGLPGQENNLGGQFGSFGPVTSRPIPPALGPQGVPAPSSLPPGAALGLRPPLSAYLGVGPAQFGGVPIGSPPNWSQAYGGYRPGRAMGPGPQGTQNWQNSTTINRTPGATQYTGNPGASYSGMGNDFRSNNFSPSSYPGGDGITRNDIGGGWRR